ncbi:MAG: DNA cytosine methyltransferase [Pseudomonadota bacterium]
MQGFPEDWRFAGAVYQVLGQIGNSVAPPVAYQVAKAVAFAMARFPKEDTPICTKEACHF